MTDVRSNNTPAAAITGAGAGLGRQIALGFAKKGYRVFGTALSAQEIEDLQQASDGSVRLTIVDVTDDQAVHSWAEQATGELGDHGLDVLISNAGILTPGPLEVLPLQAVRHEFEVNVLGSLAVINAFLPALRRGRRRPDRLGDRQVPPPVQRPFQRIESGARSVRRRLPGRAQAVRRPLRDRGARQHGHGRASGHRPRAAEDSRIHDGRASALYGDAFAAFSATFNSMQSSGLDAVAAAARVIQVRGNSLRRSAYPSETTPNNS